MAGRRFRSPYRRGSQGTVPAVAVVAGMLIAAGTAVKAPAAPRPARPVPAAVAGTGETAFFAAVLADLSAPVTAADLASLAAWASREGPWGAVGQWNPLDTTLYEPGSVPFNTFGAGLHVWNYPTPAAGAQATAVTIAGYPAIAGALRSGTGICGAGFAAALSEWSGGGYEEVC